MQRPRAARAFLVVDGHREARAGRHEHVEEWITRIGRTDEPAHSAGRISIHCRRSRTGSLNAPATQRTVRAETGNAAIRLVRIRKRRSLLASRCASGILTGKMGSPGRTRVGVARQMGPFHGFAAVALFLPGPEGPDVPLQSR